MKMTSLFSKRVFNSLICGTQIELMTSRVCRNVALQKGHHPKWSDVAIKSLTMQQQCTACYSSQSYSSKNLMPTPSIYKPAKPTRYGYEQKLFDGGLLPRLDSPIKTLPKYKPKDAWSEKKALFGQNDYIDILGDGSIQPYELIEGPAWIRGFKGNEHARTLRRLKFTGRKLRLTHPRFYKDLRKQIFYLNKEHNVVRKSHRRKSKYI